MASITQTVRIDGLGDYVSLVSGINGIISSGVADSTLTTLNLLVDSGYYTGNFNITIPNSGTLYIVGNGTWFEPTNTCYISGNYAGSRNFIMNECRIIATGMANNALSIAGGTWCELNWIHYIGGPSAVVSSGDLLVTNSDAFGNYSGSFIVSPTGFVNIYGSTIANFGIAISGYKIQCDTSRLLNNGIGINSSNWLTTNYSLFQGASGIITAGTMFGDHLTFNTKYQNIIGTLTKLNVTNSILASSGTYSITGIGCSGLVSGCCFDMVGWDPALTSLSGVNHSGNPLFNNASQYDYRLQLMDTVGSPCIEVIDQNILDPSVVLNTDQSQLSLNDSVVNVDPALYRSFIYKQGNTLLFSDYEKEVLYAETFAATKIIGYRLYAEALFSASGLTLLPAMDSSTSMFPYDWDFKIFETPVIVDNYTQLPGNNQNDYEYIIPRSVLDVTAAISPYVGSWMSSTAFNQISKKNITPYLYRDYRGVSSDFDLSGPAQPIMWSIEGRNQILSKIDAWTGETLDQYPLLINSKTDTYIYPSGLKPAGVFQNKYKYVSITNSNQSFYSTASDGGFQWLATGLDTKKDVRGILAYKGNLFVTMSAYNDSFYDRGRVPVYPENSGVGYILLYNDNHIFSHYIANLGMDYEPTRLSLSSGNAYPTDLTIYEDGTVFVADYLNKSELYIYKLAYDYALIQSSYDLESLILLRENYDNVEL